MDDLERLLIIENIRTLRARYWRYVDTKQWDQFASLFTEDCVLDASLEDFTAGPGGRAIADAVTAALENVISIHQGMQHEIEVLNETSARGIWAMEDYLIYSSRHTAAEGASTTAYIRGYGHYIDGYRFVEGKWLFSHVELHRIHRERTDYASPPLPESLKR